MRAPVGRVFGIVAGLAIWTSGASAQEINPNVEARVKRATVYVTRIIPGKEGVASGSGSFLNSNGLVITNNHVVDPFHGMSARERAEKFHEVTTPVYFVTADSGTK